MAPKENRTSGAGPPINRRRFLQLSAGGACLLSTGRRPAFASPYRVGVGNSGNPYIATRKAVEASGEWPSATIAGKTVAIKPNLVFPWTADTGVTTDPEVVRFLVDQVLQSGAREVLIVEGGLGGAKFQQCGYDFFNYYHPQVRLVDLNSVDHTLADVPGGMAYQKLYIPSFLLDEDVFFISVGKLKTHFYTHATLSLKNLVGLAPVPLYRFPPDIVASALHHRGISQAIVDLCLVRPIDFAVVDGVIAMEGDGPVRGTPVTMNLVFAGRNTVAVDRIGLLSTQIPQGGVIHLTYAAREGLGPTTVDEISVLGDSFSPREFAWPPDLAPLLEYPRVYPSFFFPAFGQRAIILYWINSTCQVSAEVIETSDSSVTILPVRTLHDWEERSPGLKVLHWDGRDDSGKIVNPGRYTIRVAVKYEGAAASMSGTKWVWVG